MKKYVRTFLHRGLMFGGFGPIIAGIVFLILGFSLDNLEISGAHMFLAIISTYILAFIQAGASVFNQIEEWSTGKSLICHMLTIYVAYITCYTVNSWIPFDWLIICIFTGIFVLIYLTIWLTVYFVTKNISKKLNANL